MAITVPQEGKIWQLAAATLGVESLAHQVAELLASYVKARPVDILGYLRSEWLGVEALQALREGQRLVAKRPRLFEDNPDAVALPNGQRYHLLRGIVAALPPDTLTEDLLEWRLQLDLGM